MVMTAEIETETTTRTCFACHVEKPLEDFPANRSKPLDKGYMCKVCRKEYEQGRPSNNTPSEETQELNRERARQAYLDNPEATKARAMVSKLISDGLIERQPCQYPLCLKEKTDAHHPDYDFPLQVSWLCRGHHHLVGRLLRGSDEEPMPILFINDYSSMESGRLTLAN